MSKQYPTLFEWVKDHPSRKERIKAFKDANDIETHNMSGDNSEIKWMAAHMPSARQISKLASTAGIAECWVRAAALMDDCGVSGYGPTEREAIRDLCANMKLRCDL